MKERSPALVIIFSIITCGIYYLYWYVVTTNEIDNSLQHPDGSCSSGGMALLLSIVTCGVYTVYWWFKQGKRAAQLGTENGVTVSDNSVAYLVLCFIGIGVYINMALLQSSLNSVIYAVYNKNARPQSGE